MRNLSSVSSSVFALVLALSTSVANAGTFIMALKVPMVVTVNIDSNVFPGVTTYYTCDGLTDTATSLLNKLGATNVQVQCSAAFDEMLLSPQLQIKFNAVLLPYHGLAGQVVTANWKSLTLRDFSDCETARQILSAVRTSLEVSDLQLKSCGSNDQSYHFPATVLVQEN